jgi:hypothetical protein
MTVVASHEDLYGAITEGRADRITVARDLSGLRTLDLAPGQVLEGASPGVTLRFADGVDGLRLSTNNRVRSLRIETAPAGRAICNRVDVADLGTLGIETVATIGRVQILGREAVRSGHIEVRGLDIEAADARSETERPHGFGVDVLQGAFTLWNMQASNAGMTADLIDISAGRYGRPVLGSGVFVAGTEGSPLDVQRLVTGDVHSDGRIARGTFNIISGGVFVVTGCRVDVIENQGTVTTYGVNDMALDNWGSVDRWEARQKVTTLGPSGIGFVNFGTIGELRMRAPIETFGQGARGFNVYAGTIAVADFDRIVTNADGAVGVQISQPVGVLIVRRGIQTFGGVGSSLVKGEIVQLAAIPLSIKPGGQASRVEIAGGLHAASTGVPVLEQHGTIDLFSVVGGFGASPKLREGGS